MTPRVAAPRRPLSSYEEFREDEDYAPIETRAFWRWMTERLPPGRDPRDILDEAEFRVLNKTTTTAGGFLVPQDMGEMIVSAARAANAVAQVALEIPTAGGENFLLPTDVTHGVAAWTAESVGYTLGDEVFGQVTMSAFKAASMVRVTEELVQDSAVPIDAFLSLELGGRLGALEQTAFTVGSGTGQPMGLVAAGSTYSVTTAATGSTLLFKPVDVLAFYKALAAPYRPNATWMLHPDDFASLAASADTAGALVFPSLQGPEPSLYGRGVVLNADLPTPAANAKSLVFGDFQKAYAIRRAAGVGLVRMNELRAETGEVVYRANERVDGRPTLAGAAVIGQHSAT